MNKKTIALGVDNFKEIAEGNHYLVDKSLLIKEAVSDGSKVILLPRPRRWGKTLNMSMLNYFFKKTENSNRHLFDGLAIENYPEIMEHQGKYPVIFLTFKEAKKLNWTDSYDLIKHVIGIEYSNHKYLLDSLLIEPQEKERFLAIMTEKASQAFFATSLHDLCLYLHKHHGVEPIVLIDEYDAPIIAGFENEYYKEVVNFMQTFLGGGFKGNLHLKKGFLTGILRISKESIFSGLNNLKVSTLVDNQYSKYFGFSESEVNEMLAYYGPHQNDAQMKLWYNNYYTGNNHSVYNPWSVLSYIDKERRLMPHWMNSSNNSLIKSIIQSTPKEFKEELELLMQGQTIEKPLVDFVTFDQIFKDTDIAFNFLLLTGYLSFEKLYMKHDREYLSLSIPNKEVLYYYQDTISDWIKASLQMSTYKDMLQDLTSGDLESFKEVFERSVQRVLSSFDTADDEPEKFYHMFVLGMLVCLQDSYQVLSNRQSGTGRYDVMIIPKDIKKIGIILEFKRAKDMTEESLALSAESALTQIKTKNYKVELEARGIIQIINVAIAFAGKKALVQYE